MFLRKRKLLTMSLKYLVTLLVLLNGKCVLSVQNDFDLIPDLVNDFVNVSDNSACVQQNRLYLQNLENITSWAYESRYTL